MYVVCTQCLWRPEASYHLRIAGVTGTGGLPHMYARDWILHEPCVLLTSEQSPQLQVSFLYLFKKKTGSHCSPSQPVNLPSLCLTSVGIIGACHIHSPKYLLYLSFLNCNIIKRALMKDPFTSKNVTVFFCEAECSYVALTDLELKMLTRLALNSNDIHLSLPF